MNYFFGIKNKEIKSKITIPRFQNRGKTKNEYKLYTAEPSKNLWKITDTQCDRDKDFFYINEDLSNNEKIFFLSKPEEIKKLEESGYQHLVNLNTFTDSMPDYRSNLRIYNSKGGFSSYQSEYPYSMIKKKGSILSPISSLGNINAEINKVFIRNIYMNPVREKFDLFFVDILKKEIVFEKKIFTNYTNEVDIEKKFVDQNVYLFTKPYLAIPIFLSEKNNHISLEHTHPPHEYILSKDRFLKVSELKKEINEIVS